MHVLYYHLTDSLSLSLSLSLSFPPSLLPSLPPSLPLSLSLTHSFQESYRVNVLGSVCPTHALLPDMISRREGRIVFISSMAGQVYY